MKNHSSARLVVLSALIAAAYAALTYLSAAFGLAYGEIQFRLSEALNVLAAFTPAAIPGLTIGCLLSNLMSPFPLDILFGTIATLFASVTIHLLSKAFKRSLPFVSILPPTAFNAVIVGLQATLFTPESTDLLAFIAVALSVAVGEIAVCGLLGVPLFYIVEKKLKRYL